jgi:hypothetical protein
VADDLQPPVQRQRLVCEIGRDPGQDELGHVAEEFLSAATPLGLLSQSGEPPEVLAVVKGLGRLPKHLYASLHEPPAQKAFQMLSLTKIFECEKGENADTLYWWRTCCKLS